jgi:hypothetical protein
MGAWRRRRLAVDAAKPSFAAVLWNLWFLLALVAVDRGRCRALLVSAHHGAAFGTNNLIGETGAVLSPAVSGVLCDATGAWSPAVSLHAGSPRALLLFLLVRESPVLGRRQAPETEGRLGPRVRPSQRTAV